jgi:phosphoglycolate phosphatase
MRTILFDLDGTLTDPAVGITRSIAFALERMGQHPPPLASLNQYIGPPLRQTFLKLLNTADAAVAELALAHYRERFATIGLYENTPYPGVADLLKTLAESGARVAVATSKPHVYAARIAEHFGFAPHLAGVFGPELDGTRDSKLAVVQHAIERLGAGHANTTMVGDRAVDIEAAHSVGIASVGVLYGYGSLEEISNAKPHHVCESVADLHAVVTAQHK